MRRIATTCLQDPRESNAKSLADLRHCEMRVECNLRMLISIYRAHTCMGLMQLQLMPFKYDIKIN